MIGMRERRLLFPVLFMATTIAVAQTPVPLVTKHGQLYVFENGDFRQLEAREPQAVFQGGNKLAYISAANDVKLFANGEVTTLERGEAVEMAVSRNLLAWRNGPALRVPSGSGASTICRRVGQFTVADSIIAFHDLMQHQIGVQWKGRVFPIADVLMDNSVPWKSGSNTLLLYDIDRRRVLLFYRGRLNTLCNGTDPSRSAPGGDVVAFMDEYDDTFRVYDRGEEYEVEPFAPASFQVGEGVVAWVGNTGAFRCYQGGQLWDLMDFEPDEYWVRDSIVAFRDGGRFRVFHAGVVETLERVMPTQWSAVGGLVAWIDTRGELKALYGGKVHSVSKEPGIRQFEVYPGVVTYRSNSGESKVWWRGKLYSHY